MSYITGLVAYAGLGALCFEYGVGTIVTHGGDVLGLLFLLDGAALMYLQLVRYLDRDVEGEVSG